MHLEMYNTQLMINHEKLNRESDSLHPPPPPPLPPSPPPPRRPAPTPYFFFIFEILSPLRKVIK